MGLVEPGGFFPLRRARHGWVHGSAVSALLGALDSPFIDALSRRRGRPGKARWLELFATMAAPLGVLAVLTDSSTDAVARSLLICFAIYSDLLVALIWFTEKDDVPNEPTQSPRGKLRRERPRGSSPSMMAPGGGSGRISIAYGQGGATAAAAAVLESPCSPTVR
jgi:hypothetical protein